VVVTGDRARARAGRKRAPPAPVEAPFTAPRGAHQRRPDAHL